MLCTSLAFGSYTTRVGRVTNVNYLLQSVDQLKQSASSATKRVFVVETMGGYCGYLATVGALASGADAAYIYEEPSSIEAIMVSYAMTSLGS